MSDDTWTERARDKCRERCADYGDLPCYVVALKAKPCSECAERPLVRLPMKDAGE